MNKLQNPHERVETDELPIVIEDGGPTEGHKHVQIVDGECGNCGYDRIKVSRKHGEAVETCMLCDSYRHGSTEWQRPESDSDRISDLRKHADMDGPLEKAGEYGPRGRFTHGNEVFYYSDRRDGIGMVTYVKHPDHGRNGSSSVESIDPDDLRGIVRKLEDDVGFLSKLVRDEYRAAIVQCSENKNPHSIHHGEAKMKDVWNDRQWRGTRFHISANHTFNDDDYTIPIHFDPSDAGIAP